MVAIADYVDHTVEIVQNAPPALRALPQWVCWRYETVRGRDTKVPYDPNEPFARARSNEPATWSTFERALERFRKDGRFCGLAFNFSEDDPFAGIDLDDCLDPLSGEFIWGRDVVEAFGSYTEVSPSGRGVKTFIRGRMPSDARHVVKQMGPTGNGVLEVYDQRRFFIVTGRVLPGVPKAVRDCQEQLTALCNRHWPPRKALMPAKETITETTKSIPNHATPVAARADNRFNRCLAAMLTLNVADHSDGSFRMFSAACRCVEHDLSDTEAITCLRAYAVQRPFPVPYSDDDLLKRVRDAERATERGAALKNEADIGQLVRGLLACGDDGEPQYLSARQLIDRYPQMRPPVIHGLLREGETMNVIAAPKAGKSWLVTDLAMAVATGRKWLNIYDTQPGDVLILDNELHGETSASRLPQVASARRIDLSLIADTVFVDNMRGKLRDVLNLRPYFTRIEPGRFKVVVLDAFYRFMPADTDENDNGMMAQVYNAIDSYAHDMKAAFVLVHHTTKGGQAGKAVTDVGAGAGAQSRASDAHLVLREHAETDVMVLDAAVRSWPPIEPICLRREFPVWNPAPELDPADLARPTRSRKKSDNTPTEPKVEWTPQMFVERFIGEQPQLRDEILLAAKEAGMSEAKAKKMLGVAEGQALAYRWRFGANQKVRFATAPQPDKQDGSDESSDHTSAD